MSYSLLLLLLSLTILYYYTTETVARQTCDTLLIYSQSDWLSVNYVWVKCVITE